MSFLYKTAPIIRLAATSTARPSARCFSTSIVQYKSATETVKDGLKAVDRTISDGAVKGLDKVEELKGKVASSTPGSTVEAQGEASKLAGQAQGKVSELSGKASGKAQELKGEAKSKLS